MAAKLFGLFLLERGLLSRESLLEAVKYQKSINLPLCALAVNNGYLTPQQISTLDAERQKSDKAFIEIALQTGMLSGPQIEELSEARSERWVFLGEALVEKKLLTLTQLNGLMEEYRREQTVSDTDVLPLLTDIPERDIIHAFIQVTVDLFVHYTSRMVKVLDIKRISGEPGNITYVFSQTIKGEKRFCYALALPEDLTLSIASHMLGENSPEINALVLDAVSEFVNVVIGNGCAKLNMKNSIVTAEAPQVMIRAMLAKVLPKDAVAVKLKTEEGEFQVLFFFPGQDGSLPSCFV